VERSMYSGRVARVALPGRQRCWAPQLREGEVLSEWVLALLTSDLWNHPEAYEFGLEACAICGNVRLDASARMDRCTAHLGEAFPASSRAITRPATPLSRR
jgi:hypothetical protein